MIAYLDTQIALWIVQGHSNRLTSEAQSCVKSSELLISPIVLVELEIFGELQRVSSSARDIERKLEQEIGLRVCDLPFPTVAEIARDEAWTRDPFDRIIVAQAKANGFAYLISADEVIAKNYPRTVW